MFSLGPSTSARIVSTTSSTVDSPVVVALKLVDSFGNTATTESLDISCVLTDAQGATTSTTASFAAGLASVSFDVHTPQTVAISLVDTFSTGLDVSASSSATLLPGRHSLVMISLASLDNSFVFIMQVRWCAM
jgi:hypothetical protein